MKQFGKLFFSFLALLGVSAGCAKQADSAWEVSVNNPLAEVRKNEVVAVSVAGTPITGQYFKVTDIKTNQELLSQVIDYNQDKIADEIVFVSDFAKNEKKQFKVEAVEQAPVYNSKISTYCSFVPERTDDFAWENDLVAFRCYGPTAQRMAEENPKKGTLSSGLDCWLKRVNYPIIDKWYKETFDKTGSYHEDTGEGLDNYHVGISRGCGSVCAIDGKNYDRSKNWTKYRILANGPVRTVFELDYAAWNAAGVEVTEMKRFVVDLGSHMVRIEDSFKANKELPVFSYGITLHEKKGETEENAAEGWIAHWEPMPDDSELGTGVIIADLNAVKGTNVLNTDEKDKSHVFIQATADNDGKIVYYNGYGWKKSGYFNTKEEWYSYLTLAAKKIRKPLKVVSVK